MPDIEAFRNFPDISFIDGISADTLLSQGIADYEAEYFRQTGVKKILYPADPIRILLYTYSLKLYQLFQYVDRAGKQDLLKFSRGRFLENIAALRGVTRMPAQHAVTLLVFKLSTTLSYAAAIPKGTKVTCGDNIFFETTEYCEIPIGQKEGRAWAKCTEPGAVGNRYAPGQLNTLEKPLPFTPSVENITAAGGGEDAEPDESLAERTFLAPSGFSVAGPDDAYVFWVKSFSQAVADVKVYSPAPTVVDIRLLLTDGQLPDRAFITSLYDYLKYKKVRPLTDQVLITPPDIVDYEIDAVYYIRTADRNNAETIQNRASAAVQQYVKWQGTRIGRDINPSVLIQLLREAGVKRPELNKPAFRAVKETELARNKKISVRYGGLESD